jgi:hypothetical protein
MSRLSFAPTGQAACFYLWNQYNGYEWMVFILHLSHFPRLACCRMWGGGYLLIDNNNLVQLSYILMSDYVQKGMNLTR